MPTAFQGAIFDVDGVLVDSPHEKAWCESLRELMEGEWNDIRDRTTWSPGAFTPQVYQEEMSGKPRMSGARAALEYFHVPDDDDLRLAEYAARKQEMVVRLIEAGDFTAYPDALRFIIAVKDAGIRVAAASSSKNAKLFLRKIRLDTFAQQQGITPSLRPGLTLLEFFDADVSGRDFAHGKPDPEMFLTAARELGVAPHAAMVIEALRMDTNESAVPGEPTPPRPGGPGGGGELTADCHRSSGALSPRWPLGGPARRDGTVGAFTRLASGTFRDTVAARRTSLKTLAAHH